MKTLDLVLKGKWYDMIESGMKTEEYREIKDYWCKRLQGFGKPRVCPYSLPSNDDKRICQMKGSHCLSGASPIYDKVRFRRGYTNKSMTFEIAFMRVGQGNVEWGAPADTNVFIIKLGKRVEEKNQDD
jgi:hypothetical protein